MIRDAHSWGCFLKECDGVVVRRVKISNHVNHNNDGLDIASRNVLVEGCDIDSEDDGLVFKNMNPDFVVEHVRPENVTIRNSVFRPKACSQASVAMQSVPEVDGRYPSGKMFLVPLPACGFFVRHADAVLIKDVRVLTTGEDPRPHVVYDDSGEMGKSPSKMSVKGLVRGRLFTFFSPGAGCGLRSDFVLVASLVGRR